MSDANTETPQQKAVITITITNQNIMYESPLPEDSTIAVLESVKFLIIKNSFDRTNSTESTQQA